MQSQHAFPWGIYIGDWLDPHDHTIPLLLDSQNGGFSVIFDEDSEETASNLIENVALKLLDIVSASNLIVDVIDFSIRKRFPYLADLKTSGVYTIAISQQEAKLQFEDLEKRAIHRHHSILNARTPDISTYNQSSSFIEKYHLLLLNLEHFPDDFTAYSRLKAFVDSSYAAGFYMIAFGSQEVLESKNRATQYILNQLTQLKVENHKFLITKAVFEPVDLLEGYSFEYLNLNKSLLLERLQTRLKNDEGSECEFLSVPIGTTLDGREPIIFSLGDQSKNYHAFIAGRSGSGKTTLLNNLIVGIAKQYTADEVRLYLMDYKDGVEFQVFENHPNCEKVYLDNQNLKAAIDLLQSFVSLKEARAEVFKQNKVSNLDSYNQLNPSQRLPRLILIIDEVHRLFSGVFSYPQQSQFNSLLEEVAKQGRSFGMHLILTTQSLEGVSISTGIMNQIALRISYVLQDFREAMKIFNEQNADAVRKLGKYEFIYNNNGGEKGANLYGRAPLILDEQIRSVLNETVHHRDRALIVRPVVINKDYLNEVKLSAELGTVESTTRKNPVEIEPLDKYETDRKLY